MKNSCVISVPATSANLGVGYDCLALALDMRTRFSFEVAERLSITGCDEAFCNENNLVWTSYLEACALLGIDPTPLAVHVDSPTSHVGGLGSSAASILAGIVAAQVLAGSSAQGPIGHDAQETKDSSAKWQENSKAHALSCEGYNRDFTLGLAAHLEGHADNVSAALYGGLVACMPLESPVAYTSTSAPRVEQFAFSERWHLVVFAPQDTTHATDTAKARKVLPKELSREVLVWQTSHVLCLIKALETGDEELLQLANQDLVHEPYRKRLIPHYDFLHTCVLDAGATAHVISGSGSASLALCSSKQSAQEVIDAVQSQMSDIWCQAVSLDTQGLRLED